MKYWAATKYADAIRHPSRYPGVKVPSVTEIQTELRGKNLACWCPLDKPCHADILLEILGGVS